MAIGLEATPGERAPSDQMRSLGSNKFGSSFFYLENLLRNRVNNKIRRHSKNWSPTNLVYGLHMISISIGNIVSFLKILNGVKPALVEFLRPDDPDLFNGPWRETISLTNLTWSSEFNIEKNQLASKEEILAFYDAAQEG